MIRYAMDIFARADASPYLPFTRYYATCRHCCLFISAADEPAYQATPPPPRFAAELHFTDEMVTRFD